MTDRFDEMAAVAGKAGGLTEEKWPGLAHILRLIAKQECEACAQIADGMAQDLIDAIEERTEVYDYTPHQVLNGYQMIAKLIRNRNP